MMNRWIGMCLTLFTIVVLTGCWDRAELPERGFVMGIALDHSDDGSIKLTTQVFRPSQGVGLLGGKPAETSYINITTENNTVSRAIRDIPINLGRKSQWSHIRLIIVSEKLARERGLTEILEFFYRDHEPRLTTSIMIAEGTASEYLEIRPLIENTTSQQVFQSGISAADNSGKTTDTNLLKLGLQMKSEVGNALVPYLFLSEQSPKITNVAGAALLKKGKLVGVMKPKKVESLQMLLKDYRSGMLDIPCKEQSKKNQMMESVEIIFYNTKLQPINLSEDSLKVHVKIKLEVALVELSCSKIETIEDEKEFAKIIEETVKQNIKETTDWLKKKKFDAIGLGNQVYRKNPQLWKRWKKDWETRFADTQFDIDVEVRVNNSGTSISKPVF